VGLLLIGFSVAWGKLGQRLEDHITLVSRWQQDIADWQREHAKAAAERHRLVISLGELAAAQKEMNKHVVKHMDRVDAKLWP
jgi:hypothetical protein